MTAKPGQRKRSRMLPGIMSGADNIEGGESINQAAHGGTHGNIWAKKQAGMMSMRTASQKPGTFNTLLKDSLHHDEERGYHTRGGHNLDTTTKSLRRDSIGSGGGNSTMMMDTGVDLLSRVQMFQIAVNKLNKRSGGADLKKEQVFKLGGVNARDTANKYFS